MVKGETGTLSLDVRTSVDKGVSIFVFVSVFVWVKTARGAVLNIRSEIRFSFSFIPVGFYCLFLYPRFVSLFSLRWHVFLVHLYFFYLLSTSCFSSPLTEESDVPEEWVLLHRHQWDTVQVCLIAFSLTELLEVLGFKMLYPPYPTKQHLYQDVIIDKKNIACM